MQSHSQTATCLLLDATVRALPCGASFCTLCVTALSPHHCHDATDIGRDQLGVLGFRAKHNFTAESVALHIRVAPA